MTREESIKVLQRMKYPYKCNKRKMIISNVDRDNEALEMAIKALSQEQTVKPMTVDEMEREYEKSKALFHKIVECDDAISRQAVLDGLKGCMCEDWVKTLFATMVEQLPSVTHKSGKWIWNVEKGYCKCSECGIGMGHTEFDYCPNCGAKMESEVRNEM